MAKKWSELSGGRKAGLLVLAAAQVTLAAAAWRDLAKRPADRVNGRKGVWAAVIAINFIGPLSYFRWGRLKGEASGEPDAAGQNPAPAS